MEGNKIAPPKLPSKNLPKSSAKSPIKSFSTQKNAKPMTSLSKTTAQKPTVVSSGERVQVATSRPVNIKKFWITLMVVLLTVLIVASTTLILINPTPNRPSDISIDFTTNFSYAPISITEETPNNYKAMPGDKLQCKFKIQSNANAQSTGDNLNVFLRIKVSFVNDNNYISSAGFNLLNEDCWFEGNDGYYYYTKTDDCSGVISPNQSVEISQVITIGEEVGNDYAGKSLNINFNAEALQANYQAIVEIWKTAPSEWSNQFRDLL